MHSSANASNSSLVSSSSLLPPLRANNTPAKNASANALRNAVFSAFDGENNSNAQNCEKITLNCGSSSCSKYLFNNFTNSSTLPVQNKLFLLFNGCNKNFSYSFTFSISIPFFSLLLLLLLLLLLRSMKKEEKVEK